MHTKIIFETRRRISAAPGALGVGAKVSEEGFWGLEPALADGANWRESIGSHDHGRLAFVRSRVTDVRRYARSRRPSPNADPSSRSRTSPGRRWRRRNRKKRESPHRWPWTAMDWPPGHQTITDTPKYVFNLPTFSGILKNDL